MKRRFVIAIAGMVLIYAVVFLLSGDPGPSAVDRVATPAISALEKFRQVNGRYPDSLEGLIPSLLAKPPSHWQIKEWRYRTSDSGGAYTLSACLSGGCYPVYYYSSESRRWQSDF